MQRRRAATAGLLLAAAWPVAAQAPRTAATEATEPFARCLQVAAEGLPDVARAALLQIPDRDRRLLALRGYVRAPDLAARWSWTDEQVLAWDHSPERARAMRELEKVQTRFAIRNPGHRLHVNTEVRSLDLQLSRWNENASVGRAAHALAPPAMRACGERGARRFADWLRVSVLPSPANLAVPGLSPHGQARAFDFQVFVGDVLVAGTDSTRIAADWRAAGWAARLADAITASDAFTGPLKAPDEPWHYAYNAQ